MFFENQESSDTGDFYIGEVLIKDVDGNVLLEENFDVDKGKCVNFGAADAEWLKEGDEVPPDPSEVVPL